MKTCDICGTPLIHIRRVTRSTYVCPHSRELTHRRIRAERREAAIMRKAMGL